MLSSLAIVLIAFFGLVLLAAFVQKTANLGIINSLVVAVAIIAIIAFSVGAI